MAINDHTDNDHALPYGNKEPIPLTCTNHHANPYNYKTQLKAIAKECDWLEQQWLSLLIPMMTMHHNPATTQQPAPLACTNSPANLIPPATNACKPIDFMPQPLTLTMAWDWMDISQFIDPACCITQLCTSNNQLSPT